MSVSIGVAAHISAASPGGPRYDAELATNDRSSIANAIWLCQVCAKLIDSDSIRYSALVLRKWKSAAENETRQTLETPFPPNKTLEQSGNVSQSTQDSHPPIASLLRTALGTKYLDISNRYTPLEVRKDLRVCPWEPKFILRNSAERQTEDRAEQVTLDYVEAVSSFHRLVILGEPGCGKSTGLYAAAYKMAMSMEEGHVPVIVNLNRYAHFDSRHPRETLIEMLLDECNRTLQADKKDLQPEILEESLRAGQFTVLFDGLNEVPANLRNHCIRSLIDFCDEFERCKVTITSRKYMYSGELPYTAMEILELGREDITGFIERHTNDGGITASAILKVVRKTKWYFFQNPLALHMMVRVFQATQTVPDNRAILIGSYVEVVLDRHFQKLSRAGSSNVSKAEMKKGLTSIAELMASRGLCLPNELLEQHLRATSQLPDKACRLLEVAVESGLLVVEGGVSRFWHHSIQEYFFVTGFYSIWKGYLDQERSARKQIRNVLKRIDKWETISLAAGLMTEEETRVFLRECVAKDEYLTAMVLNHCGEIETAIATRRKIINKARTLSLLCYWAGSILTLDVVVQVLILMFWIERLISLRGYAFLESGMLSMPLLGPWATVFLLQFILCIVAATILRRFSDYLVFARFNTVIRALQHIGTPETRSELMRIYKKFSLSSMLELNYLTAIKRVITQNICTQEELLEGLGRNEEKLYSLTALARIGDSATMPVVCNMIQVERNRFALEAAIDCIISLAQKFPEFKDDKQYLAALRRAMIDRRLPIQSRRAAYAQLVEVSGTAENLPYPTVDGLATLENKLSPRWVTAGLMILVFVVVFSQKETLMILINLFSWPDFSFLSGVVIIRLIVFSVLFALIQHLFGRIDFRLQQRVKSSIDRKWLSLGEVPAEAARTKPTAENAARHKEITHSLTRSTWRGTSISECLHKAGSHGLRHGYAVEYLQSGAISLRKELRTPAAKALISRSYRIFLVLLQLFSGLILWLIITGTNVRPNLALVIFVVGACLQAVDLAFLFSLNPYVSFTVSRTDEDVEVNGDVFSASRRFSVLEVSEAKAMMVDIIDEIEGVFRTDDQFPIITEIEAIHQEASVLLKHIVLRKDAIKNEPDYVRDVAEFFRINSAWKTELWPKTIDGTPDIVIGDKLAFELMTTPDKIDLDECVARCARLSMRWQMWIVLLDTPELTVENLKRQLEKQGLDQVQIWNLALK